MLTTNDFYELGKRHQREQLAFPLNIVSFINSCNFDSEQLQFIVRQVEDLRGSDYDVGYDDSDRSDELREYKDGD